MSYAASFGLILTGKLDLAIVLRGFPGVYHQMVSL
jgi:hypothetical protein